MFSGKEDLVLVATLLASYTGSSRPEKRGEPGYKASYHCAA